MEEMKSNLAAKRRNEVAKTKVTSNFIEYRLQSDCVRV